MNQLFPKQHNNKYKNIFFENKWLRVYNRNSKSFREKCFLYSELQVRFIELIEKHNLQIFYFVCLPKIDLRIKFKLEDLVDLSDSETMNIKKLLGKDIYHLYENQLFEVLLTIPHLNDNNNYSFDFVVAVSKAFDVNKIFNHSFNTISIKTVSLMNVSSITYDWVKNVVSKRNIFNNSVPINDKHFIKFYYDLSLVGLSEKSFIEIYCNNNPDNYNTLKHRNIYSRSFYSNFNQNKYVLNSFMLLDMQIWSFDLIYTREKNEYGELISYLELYEINSSFASISSNEFNNVTSNFEDNKTYPFKKDDFYFCCLVDALQEFDVMTSSLSKGAVKTGFADLENLEVKE